MNTYTLTQTVRVFDIAIGEARAEGRQPSHDGEYLRCVYTADGETFAVENNAGLEFSDVESCESVTTDGGASDEALTEAAEIDAEVADYIKRGVGDEYPAGTDVSGIGIGSAAIDYLVTAEAAKGVDA